MAATAVHYPPERWVPLVSMRGEDMRREDDERYRRSGVRNGGPSFGDRFNTDYLEQTSLSEFRSSEPKFELDHLATFAAGSRSGVIHAEDGLRKLRQMENTTGIWTMRCVLIVERSCIVVLDNSTGEELERFPIQLVQDPTAIFKNDRREIYNNLILFTIVEDPKRRGGSADMHIFQSCRAPAQEIVDEILASRNGQQRVYPPGGGSKIPPPPVGPAPEPPYDFQGMRDYFGADGRQQQYNQFNQTNYSQSGQFGGPLGQQRSFITRVGALREKEDYTGGSTEILERDVQLLNHCFDDIEKFVARLQQAAESYKELEKRKRDRGAKNKKRQSGDGMLNARARPPPDRDFVDIFQKFKLSFNLLAKLKAHIHDPNAPELVHFLFTPLSLIYEASRDPFHGHQNLGDQAVAPVITAEAKQLLNNCLTTKEVELWQALGKHWTTSREEWSGIIPPYVPEFYDGWQPAASILEEPRPVLPNAGPDPMLTRNSHLEDRSRVFGQVARPMPFPDEDRNPYRSNIVEDNFDRNNFRNSDLVRAPVDLSPVVNSQPKDDNASYFEELRRMGGTTIYEAAHDRQGKNNKELDVQKGDILQVLDSSKNWWKLRNYKGQVGFAPYTILKPVKTDLDPPDHHHLMTNGGGFGERPLSYRSVHSNQADTNFIDDSSSRRGPSRRGRNLSQDLHINELRGKVTSRPSRNEEVTPRTPRHEEVTHITDSSTSADVTDWLINRHFSDRALEAFAGYTGVDMFHLNPNDLQHLLGREEAIRMDGLLRLQKTSSGYDTYAARELNDILQRRKKHVIEMENQSEDSPVVMRRQKSQVGGAPDYGEEPNVVMRRKVQQIGSPTGYGDDTPPVVMRRKAQQMGPAPGYGGLDNEGGEPLLHQLIRQRSQLKQSQADFPDILY